MYHYHIGCQLVSVHSYGNVWGKYLHEKITMETNHFGYIIHVLRHDLSLNIF